MENKDKSPKPKKKKTSLNTEKKSSVKPPVKPIIINQYDSESITAEQIRRLLKEVMVESSYEEKERTNNEIDAIASTVEEFLRSFIIIGYNMKNEPLVITSAKSQLDADALYTSLARLFLSVNHSGGM